MLVVETVVRIRREHAGGKSIRAIARDLRLSRKAVRKAIGAPEGAFTYHRAVQPLPRIGPFQERLDTLLTENEGLPRRDRLRMTRIHDLLQREGFEGSYDAVRRYATRWTATRRKDAGDGAPAFIPLLFQPGEAYQFDWSHEDVEIAGKPMLQWVYERAADCLAEEVVIATDDERIMQLAAGFGASAVLTSRDHASGTDRIAEVAALRGWTDEMVVVNLQGDEPGMPAELIEQVAGLLLEQPHADVATLAVPVRDRDEYFDPNAVKVVTDHDGRALYFSRAPIPWYRDSAGLDGPVIGARRHLGLYAYRVSALRRLAAFEPSPLERAEQLEQLRALAYGLCIVVGEASRRPGPDVNTADDLLRAAAVLASTSRTACD